MEFTIIFRTSGYSNVSWCEHFTLVDMLGATSFQAVVGTSILEVKFSLNPIKFSTFSIWPISHHFWHLHWVFTIKYNFNKIMSIGHTPLVHSLSSWQSRAASLPGILEDILFNGNGSLTPTLSHARFYAARWFGWAGDNLSQDTPREHLDFKWRYITYSSFPLYSGTPLRYLSYG